MRIELEGTRQPTESCEWQPTGYRILVTGFSGLVGSGFVKTAVGKEDLIGVSRGDIDTYGFYGTEGLKIYQLDLADFGFSNIPKLLDETKPDLVIHFAAAARVDWCQEYRSQAIVINSLVPAVLATECLRRRIILGHCSTDYVFSRTGGPARQCQALADGPFDEEDKTGVIYDESGKKVNVYSASKLKAEEFVRSLLFSQHLGFIFRISFPYDYERKYDGGTPVKCFYSLAEGRKWVALRDFYMTPIPTRHIALVLNRLIIGKVWEHQNPVFHIAGPEVLSGEDLVEICINELDKRGIRVDRQKQLTTSTVKEFFDGRDLAPRPCLQGLRTTKIQGMGIVVPSLREEISSFPLAKDPTGSF